MLISFTLENWMSFKNEVCFSMVASREKQHGQRLPQKHKMRLLPIAAIYGGNASGKTNFFKAFNFAKNQIIFGTRADDLILTEPFRLDAKYAAKPSKFVFVISINAKLYEYGFSVTKKMVIEEWLTEIKQSSESNLYYRNNNQNLFGKKDNKNNYVKFTDTKLQAVADGTRSNQLFLTNTVDQKVEAFKHIYNWFRDGLTLIAPDARFQSLELFFQKNHPLYQKITNKLALLDTGIDDLNMREIPFDSLHISNNLKENINNTIKEGEIVSLPILNKNNRFLISKQNNTLMAYKLTSFHTDVNQNKIEFDLKDESDGTLRIIDLLPAFLSMSQQNLAKVFIIDELDRSLHTLLARQLLESYLASCSKDSQSQLLFTTHDLLLMDQNLFRRDEIWVTERDNNGASKIFPLSDYKEIRYDKDIRKSYLLGLLGGIPHI